MNENSWLNTERAISLEIKWLMQVVAPFYKDKNPLHIPDEHFYRLIAILIVSGRVQVDEYVLKSVDVNRVIVDDKLHGSLWHDSTIKKLAKIFEIDGYFVNQREPQLYYGHADLRVSKGSRIIYCEIDTVSVFKLWINLCKMKDMSIVIIRPNVMIIFKVN